mmetsp:Transcript_12806/g.16825  ORF Transcript_12806/g.16825 Transcript_12806/m.16825 type:complete len:189 (+) Transcript_12806:95-661(+)|eukprot:CAMPEP_0117790706 /NCGR_PEP_ID=MMETSP0948-20121206/8423_1 /TAXON_ID=44440 /ORGANISM="Chattonella subsalsa, Strain CCMP2191" /LENGTH=188 /DNA_ID=CAMNT_0005620623 /DNA_START=52 /DNA_END=618 /DNA_ORIENTATION=-
MADDPYRSGDSGPPPLPLGGDLDLGSLAPVFGVQGGAPEPDYLDYDIKGRGLIEKMFCNVGIAYLSGTLLGGGYGLWEGARLAAGKRFRLKVNSMLNHSGKRGSRIGNALGVLALMYTVTEHLYDMTEVHVTTGQDWIPPIMAGATTGLVYKATAGPRAMALAGVLGAGVVGTGYAGGKLYENFSQRR